MNRDRLFLALLVAATWSAQTDATPPPILIEPETFLVARFDVAAIAQPDWAAKTIDAVLPPKAIQARAMAGAGLGAIKPWLEPLRAHGAKTGWVYVAVDDVRPDFGPLLTIAFDDAEGAGAAREALLAQLPADGPFDVRRVLTQVGGQTISTLAIGTRRSLDRHAKLSGVERGDLLSPLLAETSEEADVALVIAPGDDTRRVLRELWPTLPEPVADLDGRLVADGMERIVVHVEGGDTPALVARLVATGPEHATRFGDVASALTQLGLDYLETNQADLAPVAEQALERLDAKLDDAELSVTLRIDDPAARDLAWGVIAPAIRSARQQAFDAQKMNNAKQIGLAMHNFYNVNNQFPAPAAIVDADGKPLLSWRVAILPYLDQIALYNRFRLDEPWDSEHNLKAAEAIPFQYVDPANPGLAAKQLTTWQRPIYPGSDLTDREHAAEPFTKTYRGVEVRFAAGDSFRQYIDGTSNTLLVTELAPHQAVLWTKPEDWRVDLDDPLAKLRAEGREAFITGVADGSARKIRLSADPASIRAAITKQGEEVVRTDTW